MTKKEDILLDIEERLKEEKWTRAAIESYSVRNFVELDSYIRLAIDEDFKDELRTLCKEHLKQSQNSVVGLYIIGVLSLEESSIDDTHIPQIIRLFSENKKNRIAEFLSEKVLSFRESKFALKTLEMVYEDEDQVDELFNIKKRLVLIDSRDAPNAKFLGEHYEAEGDKELAMFYYRLAIERYIKSRSIKMVEELWNRIITLYPDDNKLIIQIAKKIRDVMGEEKVADMAFSDVVKPQIKKGAYKPALQILKLAVDFKPHDKQIRKAIEDCYRNIYGDHSQLEKYLKSSAIGQSWKPHREAIRQFETHIAFDENSFVSHKSWGIGVVKEIDNDEVIIDFEGKPGHKMSLKIALRALNVQDDNSIAIWKSYKLDELKQMMNSDPVKVLEIILRSIGGEAASKDIKLQLVPDVIDEKEWNRWWLQAKKAMDGSNVVVQSLTKRNVFELRETEMTIVEELISRFKKTTNFENKVKILVDFVNRGGNINDENANALVSYFNEIVNASSESNERKLISFVVLKYSNYEHYNENSMDSSVIFGIKNIIDLYNSLDMDMKRPFLIILQKKLKDWDVRFSDMIINSPITKLHSYMFKELAIHDKGEILSSIFVTIMNNYQEDPDLFVWGARLFYTEEYADIQNSIGVKSSEFVFRLISLVDIMNHEIDQKSNVGRNKKVVSAIEEILFKKDVLGELIKASDESTVRSIYSLILAVNTLDTEVRDTYKQMILEKYPTLEKTGATPERIMIRHPFVVTQAAFDKKKMELNHMMTVDIPENSKAIGEAMEKGDLRENAEYKAALEKQDQLKAAATKLESELNQAKILDKTLVEVDHVDVGTRVKLKDQKGKEESYQILGQWEVDFENGIISYHSPLGRALLDKKVGETVEFEFNSEKKNYTVLEISVADFN